MKKYFHNGLRCLLSFCWGIVTQNSPLSSLNWVPHFFSMMDPDLNLWHHVRGYGGEVDDSASFSVLLSGAEVAGLAGATTGFLAFIDLGTVPGFRYGMGFGLTGFGRGGTLWGEIKSPDLPFFWPWRLRGQFFVYGREKDYQIQGFFLQEECYDWWIFIGLYMSKLFRVIDCNFN